MTEVRTDKGHLRGTWDMDKKDLIVKDGARTTVFHLEDDGTVTARDYWEHKNKSIA